jgi:CheY-like chemotaxis protein
MGVRLPNILIVDDDLEIANRLKDIFVPAGYATRVARNGLEGLQEATRGPPDIILLDVEMPILDGPGMAEALAIQRAGQPSIPIVLISASSRLQKIAEWVGTPFFLRKPFGTGQIIDLVNEALGARRRWSEDRPPHVRA